MSKDFKILTSVADIQANPTNDSPTKINYYEQ